MRIGLVLLSALVVLAFVGEASAGPRGSKGVGSKGKGRSLSQNRRQERVLSCSSICRNQLGCRCPNGDMGPPVWYARDDLPAVSCDESIVKVGHLVGSHGLILTWMSPRLVQNLCRCRKVYI